jgi:hypothetical protein
MYVCICMSVANIAAHKLNPYAIWVLAYYDVFRDCVDAETIAQCLQTIPARGSMQEALLYVLQGTFYHILKAWYIWMCVYKFVWISRHFEI